MSIRDERDRVWVVTFVAKKPSQYDCSQRATVIAKTIQEAQGKVIQEYPDAIITSAAHHGAVDIV
nr:hypothetical protein 5 [Pseudomonadaceae bacterium]